MPRSGFIDGMALSILTGNCWRKLRESVPEFVPVEEQNVILIGTRQVDPEEGKLLSTSSISLILSGDIRDNDSQVLSKSLTSLSEYCDEAYLHFDLDVFDPEQLSANQFFVHSGLQIKEVKKVVIDICNQLKISAISFTSYDPAYDPENKGHEFVKIIMDTTLSHME